MKRARLAYAVSLIYAVTGNAIRPTYSLSSNSHTNYIRNYCHKIWTPSQAPPIFTKIVISGAICWLSQNARVNFP
ncbi:hypothetical protein F5X96DRAFT_651686 [Biscogniauxia mediterranea]|nr:hypothetical protein F5X96DRAFT_651686 [Biscogniauxia mediterranea]